MPNLDGGHYFLTVLAPIGNARADGELTSPVHRVRDALETLPTARQSPATEATGLNSPFARNARTHLARFFVLDDPHFNSRDPADSIVTAIAKTDLLAARPVDRLGCPYLVFVADFDPDGQGGPEPRTYLESLWDVMKPELSAVFGACVGFEGVHDRGGFADFIVARQVETSMPFNDYWVGAPPLPSLPAWMLVAPPVIAVLTGAASAFVGAPWSGALGLGLILLLVSLGFDFWLVSSAGDKPFPAAPNATLPHVLKALYLQQAFTRFAIDNQGVEPAALRQAFASFVEQRRPGDLSGPTQAPGMIRS
jgi:hypothetical protein